MTLFITDIHKLHELGQIIAGGVNYKLDNALEHIDKKKATEKVNEIAKKTLSEGSSYKTLFDRQQKSEAFKAKFHEETIENLLTKIGYGYIGSIILTDVSLLFQYVSRIYSSCKALKVFSTVMQSVSGVFKLTPVIKFFTVCSWIGVAISTCEAVMNFMKIFDLDAQITEINKKINENKDDPKLQEVLRNEVSILELKRNEAIKDFVIAVISIALFIASNCASGGLATGVLLIASTFITIILQIYKCNYHKQDNFDGNSLKGDIQKSIGEFINEIDKLTPEQRKQVIPLIKDAVIIAIREFGANEELIEILSLLEKKLPTSDALKTEIDSLLKEITTPPPPPTPNLNDAGTIDSEGSESESSEEALISHDSSVSFRERSEEDDLDASTNCRIDDEIEKSHFPTDHSFIVSDEIEGSYLPTDDSFIVSDEIEESYLPSAS